MIYLIRKEQFNAAHRLYCPDWSEEKNNSYFGKCANPNWHGHNYSLIVTVKGEINKETGVVVNLKILSKVIQEQIIEKADHKNLNIDVDFMQGRIPSTENIAIAIWETLEPHIKNLGVVLHCIRLEETDKNSVEYYGEK